MPAVGHRGHEPRVPLAVECSELVVSYGSRRAVDHVSFRASPGEVLCILGPNGAGKTSTLECLEGYRRATSGFVRVLGLDPVADHRALVPRIGVMLQRGGLYPMLAPRRALRLFAAYYTDPEDPETLLDLVGLRAVARTPWRHLSGGEQARLSLALALVGRPELALLDEPTAGVDPEGRVAVREVIAGLRAQGACVLLTTHELAEAERIADRVVMLAGGRVIAQGSPASLAGEPEAATEVAFGAPPGLDLGELRLLLGPGATVTEEQTGRYRIELRAAAAHDGPKAASGTSAPAVAAVVATWLAEHEIAVRDLRVGRTLEEAYLDMVRDERAPGTSAHKGAR